MEAARRRHARPGDVTSSTGRQASAGRDDSRLATQGTAATAHAARSSWLPVSTRLQRKARWACAFSTHPRAAEDLKQETEPEASALTESLPAGSEPRHATKANVARRWAMGDLPPGQSISESPGPLRESYRDSVHNGNGSVPRTFTALAQLLDLTRGRERGGHADVVDNRDV
ncbi:hypothetical protein ONZ51_g8018 [Trametes cubensis]|uniref:Uncharacterized protein n=1 Tax=Trametes cubensis TaxID=1111947 RepID=A0AAD7TP22_9APHY|nr:hypothetical protein ONZ51_g8018 [Trametes cubensis]